MSTSAFEAPPVHNDGARAMIRDYAARQRRRRMTMPLLLTLLGLAMATARALRTGRRSAA